MAGSDGGQKSEVPDEMVRGERCAVPPARRAESDKETRSSACERGDCGR